MQKKILKGTIVSSGKATGFVRIIKNEKDFSKVKNKDILVIKSGERIYINIVKKGVGIIMNSGGITSHIAKISRELNKPCIILKNAVKILKNGDLVEVDTKKGIVKILKR